jgi:hypothetical protein
MTHWQVLVPDFHGAPLVVQHVEADNADTAVILALVRARMRYDPGNLEAKPCSCAICHMVADPACVDAPVIRGAR